MIVKAEELRRGDVVPASPYSTRVADHVRTHDGKVHIGWFGTGTDSEFSPGDAVTVLERNWFDRDKPEPLIGPDCRDGKCGSCVGGVCEHDCHKSEVVR